MYTYIYTISNYSEVISMGPGFIKFVWSWSMLTLESPYHDYLKMKHRHHLSVLLVYVIKHTKTSKIVIFLSCMHVLLLSYLNIFVLWALLPANKVFFIKMSSKDILLNVTK